MYPFHQLPGLAFITLVFLHLAVEGKAQAWSTPRNHSTIPAVIVFGDSTVDPGNNNFFKTVFKSNFTPYGVDFYNSTPTGRFSNGRLPTDFVASYLGIKPYIPPYLDPNLSLEDLMTGVSFASAGSGYDPLTSTANGVISMSKQMEYFAEYKVRLIELIGIKRAMRIIKKAVYIISCGTNDFTQSRPMAQNDYGYQLYMLKLSKQFIQVLLGHGAQKVAIAGLPPIGCLPSVITLNAAFMGIPALSRRYCVGPPSSIAVGYNRMLQRLLYTMRPTLGLRRQVIYFDIYTSLFDQVLRPQNYGFEVVDRGCCGTGLFEEGILCNHDTPICEDRSKYMFWDAIHPTERSYFYLFLGLRSAIDAFARTNIF